MTREEALNKAIAVLTYHQVNFCKSKEAVANMNEIIEALEKIDQEQCDDAVSRQAAINAAIDGADKWDGGFNCEREKYIQEEIEKLPPVSTQPKMGRCKDCKYFEYDSVAEVHGIPLIVAHEICKRWGDGCRSKEEGYCFLFEPKMQEAEG